MIPHMDDPPYPLRDVPDHPGRRPSKLHPLKRRRWARLMFARHQAKAWNFAALYGSRVTR